MIPLMNCSASDLGSYYNGCTVFDSYKQPWLVRECGSSGIHCQDQDGNSKVFDRTELFVHYLPPFFTPSGDIVGVEVSRSYKRAPTYDTSVFPELSNILDGSFESTFDGKVGRIGRMFFCEPDRRIECAVKYFTDLCGFFKEGIFYITDDFLAERLKQILSEEGSSYVVRTV